MAWAEHAGRWVQYVAFPHEHGDGFSYNIRLSEKRNDVIHLDTEPGTVFTNEEIVALAEYWRFARKRRADRQR